LPHGPACTSTKQTQKDRHEGHSGQGVGILLSLLEQLRQRVCFYIGEHEPAIHHRREPAILKHDADLTPEFVRLRSKRSGGHDRQGLVKFR